MLTGGEVECWGDNSYGQLGNGSHEPSNLPVAVETLARVKNVSAGFNTCAVLEDNTVACWGLNASGQLGDGSTTDRSIPVRVAGLTAVTQVSVSGGHACAAFFDGHVSCWGENGSGQLGNATQVGSVIPVEVADVRSALKVSVGNGTSCALLRTGSATCWGSNDRGQLGNGSAIDSASPVALEHPMTTAEISARGDFSCALMADGTARCWGPGSYVGGGIPPQRTTAVSVTGLINAKKMSVGNRHSCAVLEDGRAMCWGINPNQLVNLGNGASSASTTPVLVSDVTQAVDVTVGEFHSCLLFTDGSIKCWGKGSQLGVNSAFTAFAPHDALNLGKAVQVSAGFDHTCALLADASVQCWGGNSSGQAGNGRTYLIEATPVVVQGVTDAVQISSGDAYTCAVLSNGKVTCWGANDFGQLGDGSTSSHSAPVDVVGITTAVQISTGQNHTCAVMMDGTAKCWGRNSSGELGDGGTVGSAIPVDVLGVTTATAISVGRNRTCVLLEDGSVQCWGNNWMGYLGDGTLTDSLTPVVVKNLAPVLHTLMGVPSAPRLVHQFRAESNIGVSWSVPDADGLPVDKYKIEWSVNGSKWSSAETTQTSTTISGLSPATSYQVRVSAHSDAGWGDLSGELQARTSNTPSAVSVSLGSRSASTTNLSWSVPDADGLPVDKYKIEWSVNGSKWSSAETTQTSTTISGLSPATSYQVRVSAHSDAGWGTTSTSRFSTFPLLAYSTGAKISGVSVVGKLLSALNGTWTAAPKATFTYQWYACTKASKSVSAVGKVAIGCKAVSGATKSSLKLTTAHKKLYVSVLITGKNTAGTKKVFTATVGQVK